MAFPPSPQKRLFVTIVAACTVVTLTIEPGQPRAENAHDLNLETSIGTTGVGRARPTKEETNKSVMVPQRGGTGGAGQENGKASVQVDDRLEVRTTNTLAGGVEAVDGSQAAVGDVSLTGVKADALTIETKSNVAGKVEAQGGSTFRAGTVHLEKLRGKSASITSTNTLDGSVTIKKGSTVSVGNTNVGNEDLKNNFLQNREPLVESVRPNRIPSTPTNSTKDFFADQNNKIPGKNEKNTNSDSLTTDNLKKDIKIEIEKSFFQLNIDEFIENTNNFNADFILSSIFELVFKKIKNIDLELKNLKKDYIKDLIIQMVSDSLKLKLKEKYGENSQKYIWTSQSIDLAVSMSKITLNCKSGDFISAGTEAAIYVKNEFVKIGESWYETKAENSNRITSYFESLTRNLNTVREAYYKYEEGKMSKDKLLQICTASKKSIKYIDDLNDSSGISGKFLNLIDYRGYNSMKNTSKAVTIYIEEVQSKVTK